MTGKIAMAVPSATFSLPRVALTRGSVVVCERRRTGGRWAPPAAPIAAPVATPGSSGPTALPSLRTTSTTAGCPASWACPRDVGGGGGGGGALRVAICPRGDDLGSGVSASAAAVAALRCVARSVGLLDGGGGGGAAPLPLPPCFRVFGGGGGPPALSFRGVGSGPGPVFRKSGTPLSAKTSPNPICNRERARCVSSDFWAACDCHAPCKLNYGSGSHHHPQCMTSSITYLRHPCWHARS